MVANHPDDFAPIVYHLGDTDPFYNYNPTENENRVFWYPPHPDGYYYTPYAWIDGIIRGGYYYNSWWSMVASRHSDSSPLEITLYGNFDEPTLTGNLEITITAVEPIYWDGLKLRIALTEDSVYYRAPNGTNWHNYTMRDMISTPDTANGTPISITQGETVVLNQEFSCPLPLRLDYCKLVVWVQADNSGKEILQTARIRVNDLYTSIDDIAELPLEFNLDQNYPNPFNARTTIDYNLKSETQVKLDIFDLSGRQVAALENGIQSAGNHQIVWDGTDSNGNSVSSGVYFYRLSTGDRSLTKRMTLLK